MQTKRAVQDSVRTKSRGLGPDQQTFQVSIQPVKQKEHKADDLKTEKDLKLGYLTKYKSDLDSINKPGGGGVLTMTGTKKKVFLLVFCILI